MQHPAGTFLYQVRFVRDGQSQEPVGRGTRYIAVDEAKRLIKSGATNVEVWKFSSETNGYELDPYAMEDLNDRMKGKIPTDKPRVEYAIVNRCAEHEVVSHELTKAARKGFVNDDLKAQWLQSALIIATDMGFTPGDIRNSLRAIAPPAEAPVTQ